MSEWIAIYEPDDLRRDNFARPVPYPQSPWNNGHLIEPIHTEEDMTKRKAKDDSGNGAATAEPPAGFHFEKPAESWATPNPNPPLSLAHAFESAGLSESLTAKFRAKGLETVDQLEAWLREPTNDGPGEIARFNRLTDIPGVTEKMGIRIGQALFAAMAESNGEAADESAAASGNGKAPHEAKPIPNGRSTADELAGLSLANTHFHVELKESKKPGKKAVKMVRVPMFEEGDKRALEMYEKGEIPTPSEPYKLLQHLVRHYHPHLEEARIGLCWQQDLKPDKDGRLELGKCRKASDLQREFAEFDFIITLNEEVWDEFTSKERAALLDHELCHAQIAKDNEDKPIKDERGRFCWRVKKHDLEEFRDVVERHGVWKQDLELFADALRRGQQGSLFREERNGRKAAQS